MAGEYFIKDGEEYKKVEDNLLTQPEVDTVVDNRLQRERSKFADYDTLKEKVSSIDTIKSEYEDKIKEKDTAVTDLQTKLKKQELETHKVKIIHEFKLPSEAEEFLKGDTEEELRKGAEKLSKVTGTGNKIVIKKNGGKPEGKETDSKKVAKDLFGSGKSD